MTQDPSTTELQISSPVTDGGGGPAQPGRRGSETDAGSESRPTHEIQSWLDTVTRLLRVEPDRRVAIREELDSHVRDRVCDLMVTGLTEPEAVRRAIEEFGDAAALARSFKAARQGFIRRHLMHAAMLAVAGSALALSVLAATDHSLIPGGTPDRAEVYAAPEGDTAAAEPVILESGETTIADALSAAAEARGLTLLPRWSALDDYNIEPDRTLNIPTDALTLDELFTEINTQLVDPDFPPAEYRITDGMLEVSLRDDFDRRETVLVKYDIADVIDASGQISSDRADIALHVINTLQRHVSSDDWEEMGGDKISVTAFGDTLFITGPARVHPQIAWMLERMVGDARDTQDSKITQQEHRNRLEAEYRRARQEYHAIDREISELLKRRNDLMMVAGGPFGNDPDDPEGQTERKEARDQIADLDTHRQELEFDRQDAERRIEMLRDLIHQADYRDLASPSPVTPRERNRRGSAIRPPAAERPTEAASAND